MRVAIVEPWSNGQTEGQVNKLKLGGQGVSEYGPDGKAAAEIADLWAGCREKLEVKNAAKTQRSA